MSFTYEEALKASKEYFKGNSFPAQIFIEKYALKNNSEEILEDTPTKMHRRLAKEFARIENKYPNPLSEEEIFNYFDRFSKIIPQGSPMAGIGNPYQIMSLSNCEVIAAPKDSYGGICLTDQELAQLQKRRCGVGFDISTLRPKGLPTRNAAKTTDGIAIFMERFSRTTREVAQGGRRGALLLSISIHHPEVETFINIKQDLSKVTGANVSLKLTDEFMRAVENDEDYEQRFPVDSSKPIIKRMINAKKIWDQIIQCAWNTAEPGILFWDTVERETPAECYKYHGYKHESVNPCAELVLSPYDSCRLMAINLTQFVKDPFIDNPFFDYEEFQDCVYDAQRLMDDMIDLELEHIDKIIEKIQADPEDIKVKQIELDLWNKIKDNCFNGRRTGLGITGLGDTLAGLNVKYGSQQSIDITEEIYKKLAYYSYLSSIHLAEDRGSFPVYDYKLEKDHAFLNKIINPNITNKYKKYGRRNIANLTTAPTGTISILARLFDTDYHNITSGIEPAYLLNYTRRRKISGDKELVDFIDGQGDKWEETIVDHSGFAYWKEISRETDVKKSPYYKSTSNDIDWIKSVDIQAAAQRWVCHSLSKTCNVPNNSSKELVGEIYMNAWKSGLKGFTVYRDGCRDGVLIENKKDKITKTNAPPRPHILPCKIFYPSYKKEKFFVMLGFLEDSPYECFSGNYENLHELINKDIKTGILKRIKAGHYQLFSNDGELLIDDVAECSDDSQEIVNRLISTSLRHGADIKFIKGQISKCKGGLYSLGQVLGRVLGKFVDGEVLKERCPKCSGELLYQSGCVLCQCGWSKC